MALSLKVQLLTGELHSLSASASQTVWDFKIQVGRKTGLSPYQLKLACVNNAHTELRDGAQLSEYGLRSGDTVGLVVKDEEAITVFLKNANGRSSTYQVLPSDSVAAFKTRVQRQENIPGEQMWLVYEGKPLENGCKLSDYNIAPHGTIFLNLRLRGGRVCGGSA